MVLDFQSNGRDRYRVVRRLPLAAVISPQFVRRREDKSPRPEDVRIQQVSERVEVELADRDARQMTMPASQMLRREVYSKAAKGETMVRKFVMWRTNKETHSDEYPAYVVHFTDFSPNRQTPLEREVRVSSSLEQIETLWHRLKEENVKKGWVLHSTWQAPAEEAAASQTAAIAPAEATEQAPVEPKLAPSERPKRKSRKKTG
jgi:hypothetical protein